jgi:hypothetical protein
MREETMSTFDQSVEDVLDVVEAQSVNGIMLFGAPVSVDGLAWRFSIIVETASGFLDTILKFGSDERFCSDFRSVLFLAASRRGLCVYSLYDQLEAARQVRLLLHAPKGEEVIRAMEREIYEQIGGRDVALH